MTALKRFVDDLTFRYSGPKSLINKESTSGRNLKDSFDYNANGTPNGSPLVAKEDGNTLGVSASRYSQTRLAEGVSASHPLVAASRDSIDPNSIPDLIMALWPGCRLVVVKDDLPPPQEFLGDDRDVLLEMAADRDYPMVPLRHGCNVIGDPPGWRAFVENAKWRDLHDARLYLNQLPKTR